MRRVPDVIDCWFDSGAMPFAQWGFPNKADSRERFWEQFPADFISEALDQTRGWFYSQLAISTLLFGREPGKSNYPGLTREERAQLKAFLKGSEKHDETASADFAATRCVSYPHPFRNCIVLGLMLGEDGQKMSKSKRNYREPREIFDRYGADALRWFFFSNQPPWTSIRYSEQAIKETIPEFLLRLWNVYSFFVIYANIDGFDSAKEIVGPACQLGPDVLATALSYRPPRWRSELDRWVLSELNRTAAAVVQRMDQYDNFNACGQLIQFVDALSNWYVRRSRDRFWSGVHDADKSDAYWTLYECLLTTAKLIAPFVPFLAEELWQNLAVAAFRDAGVADGSFNPEPTATALNSVADGSGLNDAAPVESVHLCDYPIGDASLVDAELSDRMALVREIVSLGLSARMGAKLKVRQPLSKVEVILADRTHLAWLEEHAALIGGELNVKKVEFADRADHYITYTILPDLKRLGPRLGKRLPAVKKLLAQADGGALLAELKSRGQVSLTLPDGPVALNADDIQVRLQAKEGWAAAEGKACVVVLATELTEDLVREGLARELARAVNDRRKEIACQFTDRVEIAIVTDSAELRTAIEQFGDYIMAETLAVSIAFEPIPGVKPVTVEIGDYRAELYVRVVTGKNVAMSLASQ